MLDSRKEVPLRPDFFVVIEPLVRARALGATRSRDADLAIADFQRRQAQVAQEVVEAEVGVGRLVEREGPDPVVANPVFVDFRFNETCVIVGVDALWRQVGRRRQGDEGHGRGLARRRLRPVLRIGLKDFDRRQVETVIVEEAATQLQDTEPIESAGGSFGNLAHVGRSLAML